MRNNLVVDKMIVFIEKILRYTQGMTSDEFVESDIVVDACVFNISQLGELSNQIDEEFEESHPEIPELKNMLEIL